MLCTEPTKLPFSRSTFLSSTSGKTFLLAALEIPKKMVSGFIGKEDFFYKLAMLVLL